VASDSLDADPDPRRVPIEAGRVLNDRYEVGDVIGRGAMAEVRRGTDRVLRRSVAIKLLHADAAADPSLVRRFEREARALARVGHPNVVSVFDVGEDDGVRFIVMEDVGGTTLRDLEDR
jgi:serine/threonine-protein kinase